MKITILCCLLAVALARPDSYDSKRSDDVPKILRDDRYHPEDGKYSFDVETEDGIVISESGSRLDIEGNPVGQQGSVSFTFPNGEEYNLKFTFPNGEEYNLKFVANEHGFQPESAHLPKAPPFPFKIPKFVQDQIDKAAREDAEAAKSGSKKRYDD